MGNSRSVATAKLIFLDGAIQLYSSPVKVSQVLEQYPTLFVCSSDEMEFDDLLSAVDVEEELQMGQLYFALPLSWLARPLQAEDMADLAVKASLALTKSGGGGGGGGEIKCGWYYCCSRRRMDDQHPLMFYCDENYVTSRTKVAAAGGEGGVLVEATRGRGRRGGKGLTLTRKLSMILEE